MWCRDGLALCRGKVDTKGEQLEILEDADEEPNDVNRIARPKEWRRYKPHIGRGASHAQRHSSPQLTSRSSLHRYKTAQGNDYFFDPETEMVHYLSDDGKANYAIDALNNRTFTYDTLRELRHLQGSSSSSIS